MTTRSLLISYNTYPTTPSTFLPDNGLASLAGALVGQGHETRIIDFNTVDAVKRLFPVGIGRLDSCGNADMHTLLHQAEDKDTEQIAEQLLDMVLSQEIQFVGFKLFVGGFRGAVLIAERLRKKLYDRGKRIPLFAGGPHVDWFREKLYSVTRVFDAFACGDGEETILGLAEYVEGKKPLAEIPNLIYLDGSEIRTNPMRRIESLDSLSPPIYDASVYPAMKGDRKIKMIVLELSRGCPNQCNFCGHSTKSGVSWRTKSAERALAEIDRAMRETGTHVFRSGDSNTPPDIANGLAERLVRSGLEIRYTLLTHVNHAAHIDRALLKRSGCFSVFFGIESGCQTILDRAIHKKTTVARIEQAITAFRSAGFFTVASIIVPAPGETEQSKQETLQLLLRTRPDSAPVFTSIVIPHSRWAASPAEFGIEIGDQYFDRLLNYVPTMLLPPEMWQPLPYFVDGKSYAAVQAESGAFAEELEKHEIPTQISDDIALMGNVAGMSPKDFRDKVREILLSGQHAAMAELVRILNAGITEGHRMLPV